MQHLREAEILRKPLLAGLAWIRGLPSFDLKTIEPGPAVSISQHGNRGDWLGIGELLLAGAGWGKAGFAGRMKNEEATYLEERGSPHDCG
jgi:hypothetical protein